MGIKVADIGKVIRLDAQFDLSSNTDLELKFIKPDQTEVIFNKAGGVSAPTSAGSGFNANEYWEYTIQSGDIDQAGSWKVAGRYLDATPKDFFGDVGTFTVLPRL